MNKNLVRFKTFRVAKLNSIKGVDCEMPEGELEHDARHRLKWQRLLYLVGRKCKRIRYKALPVVWFEISILIVILAGAMQPNVRRRCERHVWYQPFLNRSSISTSWSSTKACERLGSTTRESSTTTSNLLYRYFDSSSYSPTCDPSRYDNPSTSLLPKLQSANTLHCATGTLLTCCCI